MLGFMATYPNSSLAPNAQYWVGMAYSGQRDYKNAISAQRKLLAAWPDNPKAPDAMLKKGYSQIELGERGQGAATLNAVINEFPGTEAARLANTRLRTLSLQSR